MKTQKLKKIALRGDTYHRLNLAGVKGETYDTIVSRLLDLYSEVVVANVLDRKQELREKR